jgi:hypothetical protein
MNASPGPLGVPKIIVAVHGIGDQIANATVQSVAFRVFDYYDLPPAIPLGRFHVAKTAPPGVMLITSPPDPKLPAKVGFAEVYWADIPRELVEKKYTLEEAKRWARTIVARLNVKASAGSQMDVRQYRMLETVLDELVDAVFVLDNLSFLASRAGLFNFELKKVLDDFLNDVQVVTEFQEYRERILKKFDDVMVRITSDPKAKGAEIYIVGHSEGSVVSYFGLLNAMSQHPMPPWVDQVRGLMTIGSPIETHLLLWAELWRFKPTRPAPTHGPIVWWNYFDHGDPIAYDLAKTREWMTDPANGWGPFFECSHHTPDGDEPNEVAFGRYLLPGKAHVDYWDDRDLFAHFFENVVELPRPGEEDAPKAAVPASRWYAGAIATVFPYLLVFALMFLAIYSLYAPVSQALAADLGMRDTFLNLLGFTLLLAGMTVVVRIPRVTSHSNWWLLAAGLFVAGLLLYPFLVRPVTLGLIARTFGALSPRLESAWALPSLIVLATLVSTLWSYERPARGVWPLLVPGAVLAFGLAAAVLLTDPAAAEAQDRSLWPVLLGSVFFLYIWWLATLLFDLSVIWHSYVRWSTAMESMRNMIKRPEGQG